VMPHYVHAIIILTGTDESGESCIRPHGGGDHPNWQRSHGASPQAVGRVAQTFKSITTHEYIVGVREHG